MKLPFVVKNTKVQQTFITEDFDLFVLVDHFREKRFELVKIDLDKPRGFINFDDQTFDFESIMTYNYSQVDDAPILDMIVRSASGKEKISSNKKLFVFILHRKAVYFWSEGK